MSMDKRNWFDGVILPALLALSAALLATLCYRDIFGYFFTGGDALTLIETGQVQSVRDVFRILSEPMMSETKFLHVIQMYRPTAVFSYSIDYLVWGLNPFGYHVTDVILHAVVSVFTFLLIRRLTGNNLTAWIGAALFAIHPVHMENVPAIARRHDALALAFMLPSFLLFVRNYDRPTPSRAVSMLSLVAFAFALGAKEIAPMLPILLVTYVALQTVPRQRSRVAFKAWLMRAVRPVLPYFALTVVYVGWRTYVLGGLGGELTERSKTTGIPGKYADGLLDPYGFISSWLVEPLIVALWLLVAFWVYWRFVRSPRESASPPDISRTAKPLVFFCVWVVLPLAILLFTRSFAIRRIYASVIPVTAVLAIVASDAFRAVRAEVGRIRRSGSATATVALGGIMFAVVALLVFGILWYSPLVRSYAQWRDVARVSQQFLERFSEVVPDLPNDATIHVHGLPQKFVKSTRTRPAVRSAGPLVDYSIKSWLDLNFPKNNMDVILHMRANIELPPDELSIDVQRGDGSSVEVHVRMDYTKRIEVTLDYRDLGMSYASIGEFQKAIQYLGKYTKAVPDDHLGWASLGEALRGAEQTDAAEKSLRKSLELEPNDNSTAYFNLTRLLRSKRRYDENEEVCRQWLKNTPREEADAYRGLGWNDLSRKSYGTAVEYFLKALDLEPNVHTYWGLTRSYIDGLQDYEKAKEYARKWVRFDNRDANGYLMLGLAYYHSGELDPAIDNLERSLELTQRRERARYRAFEVLGEAKSKKGDVDGVVEVYERAVLAFPDDADAHARLARAYITLGQCGKARESLRSAVEHGLDRADQADIDEEIAHCKAGAAGRERR